MPSRTVTIVVRALGATNASRQLRGVGQSLGTVDKRARGASRSIRSVGDAATRMRQITWHATTRAAMGLSAVGAAAVVTGIKFNAMMEQQVTAFSGFLGSTQAAKSYVESLYAIAARTPFEFSDVLKGTRTLVAYGMAADDARQTFIGMGDAIAATGGGADQIRRATIALGQIQAAGVLHAQDLNQLIQAGVVSLPLLTKRMGTNTKAFRKDMKENKIVAADFFEALTSSWENDPMYKGAAAKQAKTFYGQMEKLRDFSKQTLGTITEPLFEGLRKKGLPAMTQFTVDMNGIWKQKKLSFADKFDLSVQAWHKNLDPVADAFANWWRSDKVGEKLSGAFEDSLTYVGNKIPGMLTRTIGAAFTAWWGMGYKGKAVTAALLLTKMGITGAVWRATRGRLAALLLGKKGKGGKGGGLFGGGLGTITNPAYVIVVAGKGAGPIPDKPKNKVVKAIEKVAPFAPLAGEAAILAGGVAIPLLIAASAGKHNYPTNTPGTRQREAESHVPFNPGALTRRVPDNPNHYTPSDIPIVGQFPGLNRQYADIHTHVHVDGREVAKSTHRAALKKKATR